MTKDEALKLSLKAFEQITHVFLDTEGSYGKLEMDAIDAAYESIAAIKEVLAQPKQKPEAWANRVIGGRKWLSIHASKGASDKWLEYRIKEQAQGEEYEQIALTLCYQRTWAGLTDEERRNIREWQRIQEELGPVWSPMMLYLYEAIEAKLKQKNGYAEEENT